MITLSLIVFTDPHHNCRECPRLCPRLCASGVSWTAVDMNPLALAERWIQSPGCRAGVLQQGKAIERVKAEGLEEKSVGHPDRQPLTGWSAAFSPFGCSYGANVETNSEILSAAAICPGSDLEHMNNMPRYFPVGTSLV